MADPIKIQVRAKILTALQGISRGAGYHTDAGGNVKLTDKPVEQITKFPWLAIDLGTERRAGDLAGAKRRSRQEVVIKGWVKIAPGADVDLALAELDADVKKAMLSNVTLGGTAILVMFEETAPDYQALVESGLGWIESTYFADFEWFASSP